jgi:hypothetical protein
MTREVFITISKIRCKEEKIVPSDTEEELELAEQG